MTALDDAIDIMAVRHAAVWSAYEMASQVAQVAAIAGEALELLGIDPAAATLAGEQVPSVRLALDVMVWRWVENRTGLLFDFSADGGSYHRSQLAASAARMRRMAEDRAAWAGLPAFAQPPVEVTRLVPDEEATYCVTIGL